MNTAFCLPAIDDFHRTLNGKNTHLFILRNRAGMQIAISDYGARLVSALVPNKYGDLIDVVLGFDTIQKYWNADEQYHGATIGRFANRIADGKFSLNGKEYRLPQNNGSSCLHGGPNSFHTRVWDRQVIYNANKIMFYLVSQDMDNGFPGNVKTIVSYELTDQNEIIINFRVSSDKPTPINLTNHAYFNLNGEGNGDVLEHQLKIDAPSFIEIDERQIPTGNQLSVKNTPFDFSSYTKIGDAINDQSLQLQYAGGYDHSFVCNKGIEECSASAYSENSGIQLNVYTTYPTVHLYTGNFLAGDIGKSGQAYGKYSGFCLEAQHFLDNPNQPSFPKSILNPGEAYSHTIKYKFCIKK